MLQEKKERILVFSSREICYLSGNFFANQIGAAFEELGYEVEICELGAEDNLDERLEPHIGKKYRLILDFNSMLPRLEMENGKPYLDMLDGLFFDYLLDHPLFHYNCLSGRAENLHAIVLDEAQQAYVERYYPRVKTVHMLPLGATKALYEGEKTEQCRIFFCGTYDSAEQVFSLAEASPEPLRGMMKTLIARRIEEPLLPMECAFEELLAERGMELFGEKFALAMNAMYAVDAYVRDYFRQKAVDELLRCHIPVTVMGNGWEKYHYAQEMSLRREKGVPFGLSFEKIAKEHILLNVAPIFNRGMHDRIPAGMANRAVVLTDENPYLRREFMDGEQLCFYSLTDIRTLSERAGELLENRALRERIQENACLEFENRHTWKHRVQALLEIAENLSE